MEKTGGRGSILLGYLSLNPSSPFYSFLIYVFGHCTLEFVLFYQTWEMTNNDFETNCGGIVARAGLKEGPTATGLRFCNGRRRGCHLNF